MVARDLPIKTFESRLSHGNLLAAALGVFEKKGYAAARVEDILEAAGIARRTFYRYFKSKDDVLAALYGVAMNEILASIALASSETDPLLGVQRAIDVYLDYVVTNGATLRVLLGQAVQRDSPLYAMRQSFRATLVNVLTDVARRKKKDRHPLVFIAIISALEGMSLELLETPDAKTKKKDLGVARRTAHALLAAVFRSDIRVLSNAMKGSRYGIFTLAISVFAGSRRFASSSFAFASGIFFCATSDAASSAFAVAASSLFGWQRSALSYS